MKRIKPLLFLIFLLLILFLKVSVVEFYRVNSNSMSSTLIKGDNILINLNAYRFKTPNIIILPFINFEIKVPSFDFEHSNIEVGDIVVFNLKGFEKPFIKRCVATSGQKVMFDNKRLYIDGKERFEIEKYSSLSDTITFSPTYKDPNIYPKNNGNRDYYSEVIVPLNNFFVVGDNRDFSLDSRYVGFINKKNIVGKAVLIYYSENEDRTFKLIE